MTYIGDNLEKLIADALEGHPLESAGQVAASVALALTVADDIVVVTRPSIDDADTAVIAAALREHNAPLIGGPDGYPGDEFDCCAEQVAAALRVAHGAGGDQEAEHA